MRVRDVKDRNEPVLAMTMGDPCGIGPEVIVKTFAEGIGGCRSVVVGDAGWMQEAAARFAPSISVRKIAALSEARFDGQTIEVIDCKTDNTEPFMCGKASQRGATAALLALEWAVQAARDGEVDGIVTGPIHKEAMQKIGFGFPGHTEFFAERAGVTSFGMMMVGGGLSITLATIHLALREAIGQISPDLVLKMIRLTDQAMKIDFGRKAPRIAVAALNPHAGEGGLFGDEERRKILPAVQAAQLDGIDVSGPYPADTLFWRAKRGEFDAVVALYHDQALIPIKLLAFGDAVNVTLGLPFVRTSVDHGTAYDIAGRGVADPGSFRSALTLAIEMAKNRRSERAGS
jgi:4-hydroxythreonine-4-phosphate dehydrogenase